MSTHWNAIDGTGIHFAEYPFNNLSIGMAAIELGDGRLVLWGAGIDTSDAAFAELDALGTVAAVVSQGPFHHIGMPAWRARYPDALFVASAGGLARIPKQHKDIDLKLQGADALAPLLPEHVRVMDTGGMKQADAHITVRGADGSVTWFTNEVITNQPDPPPAFAIRAAFKVFGVREGLEVNKLTMMLTGSKKKPLGDFYRRELAAHPPTRLIPAHGDVLTDDALPQRLTELFDRKL